MFQRNSIEHINLILWYIPRIFPATFQNLRFKTNYCRNSSNNLGKQSRKCSQKFNAFLLLDFEATCIEDGKIQPHQEIIEFPVLQIDAESLNEVNRFHRYVRPTERPYLTSFCTNLTGIVQFVKPKDFLAASDSVETVNQQPTLPEVLKEFDQWLTEIGLEKANNNTWTFVTCGDWDLGTILRSEAVYRGIQLPNYFDRWVNLKKAYANFKGHFPRSLSFMLNELDISHKGRLHSGIDDVTNIYAVLKRLIEEGFIFANTSSFCDDINQTLRTSFGTQRK